MTKIFMPLFLFSISALPVFAQYGSIRGRIVDADTQLPLAGANVVAAQTLLGGSSDMNGNFKIENMPAGAYSLQFSFMGYAKKVQHDVIVRPGRITFIDVQLRSSDIKMQTITVKGSHFYKTDNEPSSAVNYGYEEIRRAPGSGGDVSRVLMSLPGIAKVNDQSNSLAVRGGSPVENIFFVDNIEIPNINHFPMQGASGGPIGLIHVDLIRDVTFYTGGFSSRFGDRLSSVLDISFREGNRKSFDGQLDLNWAGFGGVFEGPLGKNGSWLIAARRSYLDFVVKIMDTGTSIAPVYGDVQAKLVYDLSSKHQLSFLIIGSDDHNAPDRENGIENKMLYYGRQDIYQYTAGFNWRAVWNGSGYSNTAVSGTFSKFDEDFYETSTAKQLLANRSFEREIRVRNINHFVLSKTVQVEFGGEGKILTYDYDNWFAEHTDALGGSTALMKTEGRFEGVKSAVFAELSWKPSSLFSTRLGLRADHFSYNNKGSLSPRAGLQLHLSRKTSFNVSGGLFAQNLPMMFLVQNKRHKQLKDPMSAHFIFGIEHYLSEDTRLTLEAYKKTYGRFPLDPEQPALFLIDEVYYRYGFFYGHETLIDAGKAESKGIELMIQKKLAENFYGMISAAAFRSRYMGGDDIWRDRVFDNRYLFNIEGGYKPNAQWEFSMRWIWAGGAPYTPLDIEASRQAQREVLDKNRINEKRYPDYHSMNIRFDRRFHFTRTNLVFYLSVWNVYNRKNIAAYYWNFEEQKQDEMEQWRMLPIFGLEYEF